jgi:2-oxoglutarate ferredoxin oxidoreductase subunit delta
MEASRKRFDPHITWAADYCKHCFTCINICPVKNLRFKGDEMSSLNKCIQCQLCEKYCPDFALEVEPKRAAGAKAGKTVKKAGSRKPAAPAPKGGKAKAGTQKTRAARSGSAAEKAKPGARA